MDENLYEGQVVFHVLTFHVTSARELWTLTKSSNSNCPLIEIVPANTRASRTKITSVSFILLGYEINNTRWIKETKANFPSEL